LYVDCVAYEDHCAWESPLARDHSFRLRPKLVGLVVSLAALRVCEVGALDHLAQIWRDIDISDRGLHWQTVRQANLDFLNWLDETNGPSLKADVLQALEHWIHPLNHLETTLIDVPKAALIAERERWAERGGWI
jgi:hypothetical protein